MAQHGKSEVFLTFATLGLYAFGGPTAHFALFRKVLSEDRGWLTPERYDAYLALCQFLPGPGSSQMAAVLGWVRAGPVGAVLAMLAFALPSLILMTAAGIALPLVGPDLAGGALTGLMAAVVGVVATAVWAMLRTTSKRPAALVLAGGSTVALFAAQALGLFSLWLQPGLIALSALVGWMMLGKQSAPDADAPARLGGRNSATIAAASFSLLFIALPIFAGQGDTLRLADTVYRSGAMVFGGGHVVLPLLQAGAVPDLIGETEFLAGYGLAQAVPGPLFSFAAFIGAATGGSISSAVGLATLAALLIFLPGLLLVFAVLPTWQRVQAHPRAQGAVGGAAAGATAILTAAFFNPVLVSLPMDWRVYGLAALAGVALQFGKAPPPLVVGACAVFGFFVF